MKFVPSQDLKSRFVAIYDHMHVFCAKSVGITKPNYFSNLPTNGFTTAVVTIGELARGKGLRSWV